VDLGSTTMETISDQLELRVNVGAGIHDRF
jgi:hypothetical protein